MARLAVLLLGGIAGARAYKVISSFEAGNLSQNSQTAGKEDSVHNALHCIGGSCSSEVKRVCSCGKKASKMGLQDKKENLESGSLGHYWHLFLALQYHLQAQRRAGRCRGRAALQAEGQPQPSGPTEALCY